MTVPDDGPLHLYQESDSRHPWRRLIVLVVLLILVYAGGYLAANMWIGHGLDRAREDDEQSVGQVRGSAAEVVGDTAIVFMVYSDPNPVA